MTGEEGSNQEGRLRTSGRSRRELDEPRRAQRIAAEGTTAPIDLTAIHREPPRARYQRARDGDRWVISRCCGTDADERLDRRWERPDEAYDWNSDLGVRMLARDLICDALDLAPWERVPAAVGDRRALVAFAAEIRHRLGDREWTIEADDIRTWLRNHGVVVVDR